MLTYLNFCTKNIHEIHSIKFLNQIGVFITKRFVDI